jgi:hypothetical protein
VKIDRTKSGNAAYQQVPNQITGILRQVRGTDAYLLGLHLLCCSERTTEGYYRLPESTAMRELGWQGDRSRYLAAMTQLEHIGFAMYDEETEIVLIVDCFDWFFPTSVNQEKGILRRLWEVEDAPERMHRRFMEALSGRKPDLLTNEELPEFLRGWGVQDWADLSRGGA